MARTLAAISLALVALLAISAMMASAAQAAPHFKAVNGKYPVGVSAESKQPVFTTEMHSVECEKTTFASKLSTETTILTVVPSVTNPCTYNNLPVTVAFNECDYVYQTTEKMAGVTKAYINIVCPTGQKIEIHIYSNSKHTITACTITIEPQEKLEPLSLLNGEKEEDVEASGTVEGVAFTEDGLLCDEKGAHKNGKFDYGTVENPTTFIGTEPIKLFGE